MKNKLIVVLSLLIVVVSFTGCSGSKKYETKSNNTKIFKGDELIKVAYNGYGDSVWLPSDYYCEGGYCTKAGVFEPIKGNKDSSKPKTVKDVVKELPKGAYLSDFCITNKDDREEKWGVSTTNFLEDQELFESDHNLAKQKKGSKIGYIRFNSNKKYAIKWQCMLGGDVFLKDDWPKGKYRFALKFDYLGVHPVTDDDNFEDICNEMMSIFEIAK